MARGWTKEEDEIIRSRYGAKSDRRLLAELLLRSVAAVYLRASLLGLTAKPGSNVRGDKIHCPRCDEWLHKTLFSPSNDPNSGTGRYGWCRSCKDASQRPVKAAKREEPGWREADRERLRLRHRADPEATQQRKETRRARLASVPSERIFRGRVLAAANGLCGICRQPVDPNDWHLDHIIPVVKGGPHLYSNVQPSHPFCNTSKGAKLL